MKSIDMASKEIFKYCYWNVFAFMFLLFKGCCSLKEMKISVPEAALSGKTVTLACEYNLEEVALYSVKWYWNDEEFYRYVPKESPPFRAFTVTFANFNVDIANSGSTRVTLKNISREMTGDYKCEVSADAPRFHTDIQSAHMIVVDSPNGLPTLNIEYPESAIKIEIGKTMKAGCSVPEGTSPTPNITWFLNDKQIIPDQAIFKLHLSTDFNNNTSNFKLTTSKLEIKTNKSHFIKGILKLRCQVSIFSVWKKQVEKVIKEDSPLVEPVLGSASPQSHTNHIIEAVTSISSRNVTRMKLLLLVFIAHFLR